MKLTVAFPCYNEAENIPGIKSEVLPEIEKLGLDFEILIIDDGSSDGTGEKAESLSLPQLRVVRHAQNKGLGEGLKTIFREARGDLLVTMDADLTFSPKDLPKLVERYGEGDVDFVIGSHGLAGYASDIPKWRVIFSKLANLCYSILAWQRVKGISSLFRLYRTEIVRGLPIQTSGFETAVEVFFMLVRRGFCFAEVPTPLQNRSFGASKMNYPKEITKHLRLVYRIITGKL